ncbi:MAG: MMPL family transporter [Thermomicrobiales bacterium]
MPSIFSTAGLAAASARRPWRTMGIWLLVLIIAGGLAATMSGAINDDGDFTSNPESKQANTLIDDRMEEEPLTETVVVRAANATVDDPAFRQAVERTTADLMGMTGVVATVDNYYQATAAGEPEAERLVSADRHATIIPVTLLGDDDDLEDEGARFIATAQGQRGNGIEVYTVGDLSGDEVYGNIADEDLAKAEQVGLPVALLVLIVVFGALIAAGLPILLGIVSIFVAVGLTAVVSQFVDITPEVTVMITMIGLAVGIDYALFVIERYREERRHGMPKQEAIAVAGGTAGKAVLFSGITVILALMGMFIIPVNVFHSLAAGAILAVLVAVFATQTFIPALLSLLGDKIDFPRRRRKAAELQGGRRQENTLGTGHSVLGTGFWGRITRRVMANPGRSLVFALVILIGAALPVFALETGEPTIASQPDSDVKTGYQILEQEFYAGVLDPVVFVVDGQVDDPAVTQGVEQLTATLGEDDFYGAPAITQSAEGDLTVVQVPMAVDPNTEQAYDAIGTLRHEIVPGAFGGYAGHVYITGDSAETVDFNHALNDDAPKVFVFVLGLSFLLLLLAFRSIVVPLTAIVMNLLSVGAAYGLLVAVFQEGIGNDLLGLHQTETITAWVPIFLFCVLFGLSMDYHVFLLSRIREHYDQTHRNEESVAVGLQATGKIITGAALIMVAVFGAFASGRLVEIQQMGFGLAVAVFLDATIVRSILVPSAMKLLGDKNWYLPRVLHWLPDLRIEGVPATRRATSAETLAGD